MQGSRSIPTHTHGWSRLCLSDLFRDVPLLHRPRPRALAQCRLLPPNNPIHLLGVLIHIKNQLIPLHLRPTFQQEGRRTSQPRHRCFLNTMPLPFVDLA